MSGFIKCQESEVIHIHAWLDFCIKYEIDFQSTVLEHMHRALGEFQHEYPSIRKKLLHLYKDNSAVTWNDLLKEGTACIEDFCPERLAAIKQEFSAYEKVGYHLSLEQRSYNSDAVQRGKSLDSNAILEAPKKYQPREQFKIDPLMSKDDIASAGKDNNENQKDMLEPQEFAINKVMTKDHTTTAYEISTFSPRSGPTSGTGMPTSRQLENNTKQKIPIRSIAGQDLLAKLKEKDAYIVSLRREWRAETAACYTREDQLKATVADLDAQNKHLRAAQHQRSEAGRDPLEGILFQNLEDIRSLRQEVMKNQALHCFASQGPVRSIRFRRKSVEETLRRIGDELESVLDGQELELPFLVLEIEENCDLDSLLRVIFGRKPAGLVDRSNLLHRAARKCGWGLVLKTLIVAAVSAWVFNSAFPNFISTQPKLLQAYRKAVLGHDGWSRLHNLELAAYDSLINDPQFRKKTIPQTAQDLAIRLSCALAPLFHTPSAALRDSIFATWNQEKSIWVDRQFRIEQIFEEALELKAKTLLSDELFDFIVHSPGEKGESQDLTSTTDDRAISGQHPVSDQGDFHTLASFHIYPSGIKLPRDLMNDALIKPRNFLDRVISTPPTDEPSYTTHLRIQNFESSDIYVEPDSSASHNAVDIAAQEDADWEPRRSHSTAEAISSAQRLSIEECETNTSDIQCQRCSRIFGVKGSLANHVRLDRCLKCNICDIFIPSRSGLQDHNRNKHPDLGIHQVKRHHSAAISIDSNHSQTSITQDSPREKKKSNEVTKTSIASTTTTNRAISTTSSETSTDFGKENKKELTSPRSSHSISSIETTYPKRRKGVFKCPVCPKSLATMFSRDRHFDAHPTCLQTGTGHITIQSPPIPAMHPLICQVCKMPFSLDSLSAIAKPQVERNHNSMSVDIEKTSEEININDFQGMLSGATPHHHGTIEKGHAKPKSRQVSQVDPDPDYKP